jgi:hypothetical protein
MVKFVGLEDPGELLAQTEDLKRGYLAALQRHNDRLAEMAQRNGCEWVLVDTSRSMSELLIDYLNKRSVLARGR